MSSQIRYDVSECTNTYLWILISYGGRAAPNLAAARVWDGSRSLQINAEKSIGAQSHLSLNHIPSELMKEQNIKQYLCCKRSRKTKSNLKADKDKKRDNAEGYAQ